MVEIKTFDEKDFKSICDYLGNLDHDLKLILDTYRYPPLWKRIPSFETLVHIILEQQVSLASALAALNKLKDKIDEVTPAALLSLSNEELRACYFSRQKIIYTRHLAAAILKNELNIEALARMDNDSVRNSLTKIKGIGNWTVDVYLMMVLQRTDLFPMGDVALIKSFRESKNLPAETPKELIRQLAAAWTPYQTIAAFILWHSYLCRRKSEYRLAAQKTALI